MKKSCLGAVILAMSLPISVQAQERLTQEQLIQLAIDRNTCDGREVLSASYVNDTENRVGVTCGDALANDGSGLGGSAGVGAAVAAGVLLFALAAGGGGGGGGSTPDTQ